MTDQLSVFTGNPEYVWESSVREKKLIEELTK